MRKASFKSMSAWMMVAAMIATWFVVLHFVLAELSGWCTVFCVLSIVYGMLGMYTVAEELEKPSGTGSRERTLGTKTSAGRSK